MKRTSRRIDKSYIAPHLSIREKIVAGAFITLDVGFLLFGIGTSVLVCNLFSPTYPRKAKLVNGLLLFGWVAAIGGLIALLIKWMVTA